MARAGRKRTSKKRAPKLQPWERTGYHDDPDDRVRTSRQPHRRPLAKELRVAEEAESPLGRLYLAGRLALTSDREGFEARDRFDAGTMFAAVVGAYRSVVEAPRDVAGSGRGFPCRAAVCAADAERWCECLERRNRYMRAYEALAGPSLWRELELVPPDMSPPLLAAVREARRLARDAAYIPKATERRRLVMAVNQVVVHRQAIEPTELVYLVQGLSILVDHFGLTTRRRQRHDRNAK